MSNSITKTLADSYLKHINYETWNMSAPNATIELEAHISSQIAWSILIFQAFKVQILKPTWFVKSFVLIETSGKWSKLKCRKSLKVKVKQSKAKQSKVIII